MSWPIRIFLRFKLRSACWTVMLASRPPFVVSPPPHTTETLWAGVLETTSSVTPRTPNLYQDRPIRISLRFRSRSACWVVSVRESNHWLAVLNEQQNEIHLGELNSLATVTDKFFSDDTIRHLADAFSRTCDSLWTVYVWGNISCGFNCSV